MPTRTADEHPNPSGPRCYCGLWHSEPKVLERQGIPRGYCGLCQVCGQPGHARHFPGAVPVTGAWCEKHYLRLRRYHPLGSTGFFLWATIAVLVVAGLVLFWTVV